MSRPEGLVEEALSWVRQFFRTQIAAEYVFHDFEHTVQVWAAVRKIAKGYRLSSVTLEVLELAAIFHDTGFDRGAELHEERSCRYAAQWLRQRGYPEDRLALVLSCILATRLPHAPHTFLERVICDADMCYLGLDVYADRSRRLRQELLMTRGVLSEEAEWLAFEMHLIKSHTFFTSVAELLFGPCKRSHLYQLESQYCAIAKPVWETVDELAQAQKKKKKRLSTNAQLNQPGEAAVSEAQSLDWTQMQLLISDEMPTKHLWTLQGAAFLGLLIGGVGAFSGIVHVEIASVVLGSVSLGVGYISVARARGKRTIPLDKWQLWLIFALACAVAVMVIAWAVIPTQL